ncbi:stage II sporulation protein D [Caloranaerobacter azorensis DSM 13643]|uniref:Stage II sporulation protein D n=1 Tax=Caloranaerobacter azorensis DSM 13643 TaxID=1121264 RepID=A0A1M5VTY0_9FIRM|nr:stage II sporulation protein D [Caloranaerobacter azorensis]SHH78630.1 stage II sporulation protein D [Caloranaerobacter azorensis DSM 13643]
MRELGLYLLFLLFIIIIIPILLLIGGPSDTKYKNRVIEEDLNKEKIIKVYNINTKEVEEIELDEYIKGVVAAEMPAAFEIEALKAQAVAARTYAIYHLEKFKNGHPDHPEAPLCTGIHCQAWLSKDELIKLHSENWMKEYWPKIEQAVDSTRGLIITYNGKPIEPLFHSTSGGMTEDSEAVFASKLPYLRSVPSPYEDGAPKLREVVKMTVDEFISKIKSKYPNVKLTKNNLQQKIKLIERSHSGRVMKIMIDGKIVSGREIRGLFNLNSTNFKIMLRKNGSIEIETVGYGHGVGMSQWGANGMAKKGSTFKEILKHYYTGVEIKKIY